MNLFKNFKFYQNIIPNFQQFDRKFDMNFLNKNVYKNIR